MLLHIALEERMIAKHKMIVSLHACFLHGFFLLACLDRVKICKNKHPLEGNNVNKSTVKPCYFDLRYFKRLNSTALLGPARNVQTSMGKLAR